MAFSPVGLVTVAAPGTPVQLTATRTPCRLVSIQPIKGFQAANAGIVDNVGAVYIGRVGMNKATGVNVIWVLQPEQASQLFGNEVGAGEDPSLYYVDADNAGDSVLVSYGI